MAETDDNQTVDPISLEVYWSRLTSIAEEMGTHFHRTAFSEVVKYAHDFSTAIFTDDGELLAQGVYTPGHLGCMPNAMQTILEEHFPPDTWNPGDVVITNDPYIGAGHLTDIFTFEPVFVDGELVGFCVLTADYIDLGGSGPGSIAVYADDIYEEGLQLPPLKLREEFEYNEAIIDLCGENSREPEKVTADLKAQCASSSVGRELLSELLSDHGIDVARRYNQAIFDRSERSIRDAIAEIPDGTYRFEDTMDGFNQHLPISVRLEIEDDNLLVDFAGTADQQPYAINATSNYTFAYVLYTIKAAIDPDTPQTEGSIGAIEMEAPEKSLVNVSPPAPVSARARTVNHLISTISGALHKAIPGKVPAAGGQQYVIMAKFDPDEYGNQQILMDGFYGGAGGRSDRDGVPSIATGSNVQNNPIEVTEEEFPVIVQQYTLTQDTAGLGKFRGGSGSVRAIEFLEPAQLQILSERFEFPNYGLEGGQEGSVGAATLEPEGRELSSKARVSVDSGDVLHVRTAGGGGYGDPTTRRKDLVEADIANGIVSEEFAERYYNSSSGS